MFSALRQNSLLYILDKTEGLDLKVGQVVSVTAPQYLGGLNQTVDVSVKVNNETINFEKLPSTMSIANIGNNIVVSETSDAMETEVDSIVRNSKQLIDSIPYHQNIIKCSDDIRKVLNPGFAKQKEQEDKIRNLESKVGSIETGILDMKAMMSELLNKK